ncbi:hypothetical protein [Actinophytocola sp.]|uniref:hypothetical protein n=1 Tax=Actinophytocola sp. TaxID=1872138 RepID=UPI00389B0BCB
MSRRTRQLLLMCALALSVIGMHHVPLSPHCTPHVTMSAGTHAAGTAVSETMIHAVAAAPDAQPNSDSGTGHDMLHLCLAVLWAAGGLLLLAWLLVAVGAGAPTPAATLLLWTRRVWRPPGTTGRSLLASLCVLRT